MSAFIVADSHINAIVSWAGKHDVRVRYGNPLKTWSVAGDEQDTAQLLLRENIDSVNYRYGTELPLHPIEFNFKAPNLSAIECIKAIHCLEYQSCEHEQWNSSLACALLREIASVALRVLPGYNAARWEVVA
jgi:hypothetical protein